jgi:RimJ/RimL family protein N-acetyltransferase
MIDPVMVEIPVPIETSRLLLRPCAFGDGALVAPVINSSLEDLKPWMTWAQGPQTVDEAEANSRVSAAKWAVREDLTLRVFEKSTGALIGGTGLHRIDWTVGAFEIGYWIATAAKGKGYATECSRVLTFFAFEKLNARRVTIHCDVENLPSRRIAEKLGFDLEGIRRNDSLTPKGAIRSTAVYSRISLDGLAKV